MAFSNASLAIDLLGCREVLFDCKEDLLISIAVALALICSGGRC
jgi:hypothetical protein